MKISLITVSYNSDITIKNTLESVLKQSYDNYEYIIIDGKSTDNTLNIIKDYDNKFNGKLKYISESDKGIYDAMNKGIKMASGDIIGILNSDDILAHNNVFKNIVENIKNNDGIYSNLLMLDENLQKPYRLFQSKKISKKFGWHMPHPTLYLKKEVYQKYGNYNINYKIAADLDFMLRIINSDLKIKYYNDFFVYMRSGGVSTNGLKGYINNFKESYKILKKNKIKFSLFVNFLRTANVLIQKSKAAKYIKRDLNKKRLVQINTVCYGSTGQIMSDIQKKANEQGYETLSIYGRGNGFKDLRCIKVGGFFSFWLHVAITTFFDRHGCASYFKTKKIIKILKEEMPNIIHLHNIHGYYINYPLLFKYLKNDYDGKIFWTLHDCWTFTGHCPHFTSINCNKWKKKCYNCPKKKKYPISLFLDNSKKNYIDKRNYFTGLENLTIITPSKWLKNLVNSSFLNGYETVVLNNGIDLNIFKQNSDTDILNKYNIPFNKKIILGVASVWTKEKGFYDFIELSKLINDEYVIVLVGVNKKQKKVLKKNNIIAILRTENKYDLANLYSIAHVFVNPTYEDNYPTVNLEAIACCTPVITYDTGGCSEQISDSTGIICSKIELINSINNISKMKFDNKKVISKIDKNELFEKVLELYRK